MSQRPFTVHSTLSMALTIAVLLFASMAEKVSASVKSMVALPGHVVNYSPYASYLAHTESSTPVQLAVVLQPRNVAELDAFLKALYDPKSPNFHKYLTSDEFTGRYCPTQADYNSVKTYLKSQGLIITNEHKNRLIIDVMGTSAKVEKTFNTRLNTFCFPNGRVFHAPSAEPMVPSSVSNKIMSIVGLDTSAVFKPHVAYTNFVNANVITSHQIGSGTYGGLTPNDIKLAYNLYNSGLTGAGQTLAVFELDGYTLSDIKAYEAAYNLPDVPIQNIYVDGYNGAAGSGAVEVTLDIELQIALAPGATKILVYEAANSFTGLLDEYNKIATDNLAQQISTSWGLTEIWVASSVLNAENTIFKQMAAQGQTIYAAAGDCGAYDDGASVVCVDDPSSQPYMCGVGGTKLSVNSDHLWIGETTWNEGVNNAGGGGQSVVWPKPSYQNGLGTSATMRNVPDVSLNSDPYTGYSIYYGGRWGVVGGTSCASPLWAAFTALVNQQLKAQGGSPVGFANPVIYKLATGSYYKLDFHDINDLSTNRYYQATTGYDDATGFGSFNGRMLLADIVASQNIAPTAPTSLGAAAKGSSQIDLTWNAPVGALGYYIYRSSKHGGPYSKIGSTSLSTYSDKGLTASTTYYYVITAVNTFGASGYSNEATATTTVSAPSAPANLAATAGGSDKINLTWSAVTAATSYNILRGSKHGGPYTSVGTSTTASFADKGLTQGTTYYYVVTGANVGGASSYSNEASATTTVPAPTVPTGLKATATSLHIDLSWSASSGATSYNVLRSLVSGGPYSKVGSATGTTYSNTGLQANTKYYYVVVAVNSLYTSAYSNEASATTTIQTPPAPTSLVAKVSGTSTINLTWSASEGATSYKILRSPLHNGPYLNVGTTSSCAYSDTSLPGGITYYYVVTASNTGGTSSYSNEASDTTPGIAPAAPTIVSSGLQGTNTILLTWTYVSNAPVYALFFSRTKGGPYTILAYVALLSPPYNGKIPVSVSGMSAGTYYFVVKAANTVGRSDNSNEVCVSPTTSGSSRSLSTSGGKPIVTLLK